MQLSKQTLYQLAFNALGILVALVVVGYIVRSLVFTETEPPCATRYPAPHRFALTAGGTPMSAIELQARAGLPEWGVLENASVVTDASAPTGAALEITLADLPDTEPGGRPANGLDFRWTPSGIAAASSACLTYSVWLPEEFGFGSGGLLPGILGSQIVDEGDNSTFGTRLAWEDDGKGSFNVAAAGLKYRDASGGSFALPTGRWLRIEQELVLNAPGESNGVGRMWIDGRLAAEDLRLAVRTDPVGRIAGVLVDVGYVQPEAAPSVLRLSPFELAWK
jgi:polysaccharide lyase-like protein